MRSVSRTASPALGAARRLRPAARRGGRRLLDDPGKGRRSKQARIEAHPRSAREAPAARSKPSQARPRKQDSDERQAPAIRRRNAQASYEPCEECGAPMDPQQRYCVNCAARRGNGANPSSRYFAAMSKQARRPLTAAAGERPAPGSRAAAVGFFALLPIAVAIGVVVGRSGSRRRRRTRRCCRRCASQDAAAAASTGRRPATTADDRPAKPKRKAQRRRQSSRRKARAKWSPRPSNGDRPPGHRLQSRPRRRNEEDTKLVEENPEQAGDNYIKAQQNLPDVIVVGGDPAAPAAPSGRGGTMSRARELRRRQPGAEAPDAEPQPPRRERRSRPKRPSRSRRRAPSWSPSATACWRSSR